MKANAALTTLRGEKCLTLTVSATCTVDNFV